MKRRIEQLLNGIFEYKPDRLLAAPEEVTVHVNPGTVIRGSLHLQSESEKKIKGFVYTSSPRIICVPVEFQGIETEIQYQIDCSGLTDGAEESGAITICSDIGEYVIPVQIQIKERTGTGLVMPFETMQEFAALARTEFQKAYRFFLQPEFREFLSEKAPDYLVLYDGLSTAEFGYLSLEHFLTASGLKETLEIALSASHIELKDLNGPVQETIQITRSTWGFQKIQIETDTRFLRPEKKTLTTDEFAGSTYDLSVVLDTNLMHAGNNYGRLTFTAGGKKQTVEVSVRKNSIHRMDRQSHIRKIMMKKMESLYIQFRLKKIDLSEWVENSISVINSYRRAEGKDPFAELFLVQLYFADGKQQKAYKILEQMESQRKRMDTPERYGYYLYMTTFFYHEASYVDRVEDEISRMFFRNKTSWKLQWILLYLQEKYLKDEDAKYDAVEEQFGYGCRSRIMYLEAYQILKKNPFRMRHIGPFELQLLRFAMKEDVLTAEVMRQVSSLVMHQEQFDARLFEVLVAGHQLYPSVDLVKAICHLLIKGDKKESCYFPWYAKGVDSGLRLTGLYEYYMETMDSLDMQKMPQIIRMYFAYDTSLDYRRRAAIYRKVAEQRENDAQTYHNYRPAMEKFTVDQLEAGRISEDLSVLYRCFLRKSTLTKTMAEKLTELLFTYEIQCDSPELKKLILRSGRLAKEQILPVSDGKVSVQIFDPDSVLLLEDEEGIRWPVSQRGRVQRVFENEEMLSWCREKAAAHPGMVLHVCRESLVSEKIDRSTIEYFTTACELKNLSDSFRRQLRKSVLQYYVEHLRDESLPEFLEQIPYLDYVKVDKAALVTLLAEEGKCMDAFTLLDAYGAEGIPLVGLVRICSRMVLELEFEENTMLVSLCHYCFSCGKYDDKLLRYLLLYYEGPVETMIQVWQAAHSFELDTMLLEEKIMMMIIFTHSGTEGSEPVFESYSSKMGRKKLCRAYANLKAYEYFVKGLPVADCVFLYIQREYSKLLQLGRQDELEMVCRLALLQYYAVKPGMTEEQRNYVRELLAESSAKGLRFAFWQRFDEELLAPYEMEGRVFAEYVGNPDSEVNIYYRRKGQEEEYRKEAVKNYFEGIFVREFTLFYGEEMEYWLEEEYDGETKTSDVGLLQAGNYNGRTESRYQMLGKITRLAKQGREQEAREEIESYLLMEYLSRELFTLV